MPAQPALRQHGRNCRLRDCTRESVLGVIRVLVRKSQLRVANGHILCGSVPVEPADGGLPTAGAVRSGAARIPASGSDNNKGDAGGATYTSFGNAAGGRLLGAKRDVDGQVRNRAANNGTGSSGTPLIAVTRATSGVPLPPSSMIATTSTSWPTGALPTLQRPVLTASRLNNAQAGGTSGSRVCLAASPAESSVSGSVFDAAVASSAAPPAGGAGAASAASSEGAASGEQSPLTTEQQRLYDLVMTGSSVFITGPAGSGKSHLMRTIIADLRQRYAEEGRVDAVYVTAPTGIAACNVGGITVHAFAGIGTGDLSADKMAAEVAKRPAAAARWKSAVVLVIDEISMLDGNLFEKLEAVARHVRNSTAPFGGLQLILAGDFFQLPPVGLDEPAGGSGGGGRRGGHTFRGRRGGGRGASSASAAHSSTGFGQPAVVKFCFEAACWNRVLRAQVSLQQVLRQRDEAFVRALNQLRVGVVTPETERLLESCGKDIRALEAVRPTARLPQCVACKACSCLACSACIASGRGNLAHLSPPSLRMLPPSELFGPGRHVRACRLARTSGQLPSFL